MSYLAYPIKILQKNQCIQYRVCFLFINNHIRNLPNLYATFLEDEDNRYLSSSSFATYKMLIQVISTVKFCLIHIIVLSVQIPKMASVYSKVKLSQNHCPQRGVKTLQKKNTRTRKEDNSCVHGKINLITNLTNTKQDAQCTKIDLCKCISVV